MLAAYQSNIKKQIDSHHTIVNFYCYEEDAAGVTVSIKILKCKYKNENI